MSYIITEQLKKNQNSIAIRLVDEEMRWNALVIIHCRITRRELTRDKKKTYFRFTTLRCHLAWLEEQQVYGVALIEKNVIIFFFYPNHHRGVPMNTITSSEHIFYQQWIEIEKYETCDFK